MAELKTFVFTDICRSVDLKNEMIGRSVTERDMAFIQQILIPHRERIEQHLEENTGRVVSTAGDGHFLVFNNTILAAMWATDVQKSHRADPIVTPDGGQVEVRISMHVGVPQVDPAAPDNFVGKSVDYASRLNDYATGGQILVSRSVMAILDDVGLEGISFHLHGRRRLKGIGHVEVHELIYDDQGPRPLRQQPSAHSNRQWTVVPTMGFQGAGAIAVDAAVATTSLKRVGNYELEAILGSGGMGDVYKGRHTQFGRLRAIKVIKPQFVAAGNEEVIRRFYQEIKAIGALEHKNIVVAIDSSSPSDHVHYLVMEYIEGVSLDELVEQQGPLEVNDASEIIRQAARGLQYIHRNGMVHRDIKPSNLILTLIDGEGVTSRGAELHDRGDAEGVVKILDLGLALLAGDTHDRLTRYDNRAMGTGMYMSPEQWRTTSVDIRADIYSLGCTLYHLLAGKPPFLDSDLRPEKAHEKSRIPAIRNNDVPRKLWDVLEKMMAKRPEDRYTTPAEVATELAPFAEGSDLVTLVREYMRPSEEGSSRRLTQIDSGARVDTWLSRASHLRPTRQMLLRWVLPTLLVAGCFGFLWWSAQQAQRVMTARAEQLARDTLPQIAERVAETYIGAEITKRFNILQEAASETEMLEMVEQFDADAAREALGAHPLLAWIREHRRNNVDRAHSDSWFINDRNGTQIARHPLLEADEVSPVDSFLENYAFRDYFHGLGKDLSKEEATGIDPITEPNLSAVYRSSTSGKLKVAFSVPIWDTSTAEQQSRLLGILSMSVDLGEFEVLNQEIQRGKDILLIDMREDYFEADPRRPGNRIANRGMILHHPRLGIWRELSRPPRVSPEVLAAIEQTGEKFVSGYHDPLSLVPYVTYWGALEQVEYTVRDDAGSPRRVMSGWWVLVQSPTID